MKQRLHKISQNLPSSISQSNLHEHARLFEKFNVFLRKIRYNKTESLRENPAQFLLERKKHKMKKKFGITAILGITLCASLFGGCGKDDKQTSAEESNIVYGEVCEISEDRL